MRVVCVNVGERYPNFYVERLYQMCRRHLPVPFEFLCVTDRRRELHQNIIQKDIGKHPSVEGWWSKLKLFDRSVFPEEFLFFDLDTILIRDLTPLVQFAEDQKEAHLITLRDFTYGTLSSAIMWVRPSNETEGIWNAYIKGERFEELERLGRLVGDQDFIEAYLKSRHLDKIAVFFPDAWFVSYKKLRRLHTSDRRAVREKLDKALILCFHGEPRPHQAIDQWKSLWLLLRHKPLRVFSYWRFLEKELREWWR